MGNSKFSIKDRLKSFIYAFRGIGLLIKHQHNAWIHLIAITVTLCLGWYTQLNKMEWMILFICYGTVLAAETFNSSIEELANKVELKNDPQIKNTKDLAAGAVLITALMAAIIGGIIFIPKFL